MKAGIHPAYNEINVICACGHTFKTRSTHKGDIRVEICSSCHPFFTGRQKLVDTAGRIDRFEKKYKATRGDKESAAAGSVAGASTEHVGRSGSVQWSRLMRYLPRLAGRRRLFAARLRASASRFVALARNCIVQRLAGRAAGWP